VNDMKINILKFKTKYSIKDLFLIFILGYVFLSGFVFIEPSPAELLFIIL